jgi:hypothetical protein
VLVAAWWQFDIVRILIVVRREVLVKDFKLSVDGLKYGNDKLDTYVAELLKNTIENPIYIHMDNGTDWGVLLIGVAGIATSAIVGYLGYRAQKNQIRANACNLRHHWINELRNCAAVFLQLNSTIIHRSVDQEDYDTGSDYFSDYHKSLELHVKINLMVSSTSEIGRRVIEDGDNLVSAIKKVRYGREKEADLARDALTEFEISIKDQLDRAWDDIKGDLGLNERESLV